MTLDDFLEVMAARPFVPGECDCALTLADWVSSATGCSDPAADLRGAYTTMLGAARFIVASGGLVELVGRCAARAGLFHTDSPLRGDIGVVELDGAHLGGICTGDGVWAIQSTAGVFGARTHHLAAWSVPHG